MDGRGHKQTAPPLISKSFRLNVEPRENRNISKQKERFVESSSGVRTQFSPFPHQGKTPATGKLDDSLAPHRVHNFYPLLIFCCPHLFLSTPRHPPALLRFAWWEDSSDLFDIKRAVVWFLWVASIPGGFFCERCGLLVLGCGFVGYFGTDAHSFGIRLLLLRRIAGCVASKYIRYVRSKGAVVGWGAFFCLLLLHALRTINRGARVVCVD